MQKTLLVPVADGTEELEAVAIIDALRRAGAEVTVASVTGARQITASRGVEIGTDTLIEACAEKEYNLVVLPGTEHLRDSAALTRILQRQNKKTACTGRTAPARPWFWRITGCWRNAGPLVTSRFCRAADGQGRCQITRGGGRQLLHQPGAGNRCRVCPGVGGAVLW